jgi:hypothetical protein
MTANQRSVASMCSVHERGLPVLIECVDISSGVQQGKGAADIAGRCCFKPVPIQMAPNVSRSPARKMRRSLRVSVERWVRAHIHFTSSNLTPRPARKLLRADSTR